MLNRPGHENALTGKEVVDAGLKNILNRSKHYLIVYDFRPATDVHSEQCGFQLYRIDKPDFPTNTPRRDEVLNFDYIIMDDSEKKRVPLRSVLALNPNVHLVDFVTWRTYEDSQH